jgi:hypothetical protein
LTFGPFERTAAYQGFKHGTSLARGNDSTFQEGVDLDDLLLDQPNTQNGGRENGEEEDADEEFIDLVNDNEVLKIQIFKLDPEGHAELVWDLQEYLENNKEKTA